MKKKSKLKNLSFVEKETLLVFVDFKKKKIKGTVMVDNNDGSNVAEGTEEFIKSLDN